MTQIITNGFGIPNRILTNGLGADNVVLHYLSQQEIDSSCLSEEYEESRKCIFGEGGFIKDKPLTKLVMLLCDYKKAKAYIKQNEYYIDRIQGIYKEIIGRYWLSEILTGLIARTTNYFQALYSYIDENKDDIYRDIQYLIHEFIYRNMNINTVAYIDLHFVDIQNKYVVGLSICVYP